MNEQHSDEWVQARLGKVTASRISDLMATTRNGWGASRKNYAAELVVERLTREPAPKYRSPAMLYGTECEPEARFAYAFRQNVNVVEVGFCPHPVIKMSGASPDGLIGDNGLVEFKCPNTASHLETLLRPDVIDDAYMKQIQFQLACTGRQWCDFVSYDKRLPEAMRLSITNITRDDKLIANIEAAVLGFLDEIDGMIAALRDKYPVMM